MKRLFAMFMALALTALVPLSAQASGEIGRAHV